MIGDPETLPPPSTNDIVAAVYVLDDGSFRIFVPFSRPVEIAMVAASLTRASQYCVLRSEPAGHA